MKKLRLLLIVVFAVFAVSVQGQIKVGGTLGLQMPVGDFADGANVGVGLHAVGKYLLNEKMAVGLNIGFSKFGSDYEDFSYSMVPITGLFEYYLGSGNITPYVGGDVGLYSFGAKYKILGESDSDSELYFGLAPTAGVLYKVNDLLSLCGNLKYNIVFAEDESLSYLGINVGIIYSLNK